MITDEHIRVSKDFKMIIDYIKAKCLLYGKKVPNSAEITYVISKQINKDWLWQNEFFK
jgi:hypothetical protein